MTPWRVVVAPAARKDLARLPRDVRQRIVVAVDRWATTGAGDIKPLVGMPEHRLRVGRTWRVRIALDHESRTATVLRVLPRGSAYQP